MATAKHGGNTLNFIARLLTIHRSLSGLRLPPTLPPLRNRAATAKTRGRKAWCALAGRESRQCRDLAACELAGRILVAVLSLPPAVGNPGRDCRPPRGSLPGGLRRAADRAR